MLYASHTKNLHFFHSQLRVYYARFYFILNPFKCGNNNLASIKDKTLELHLLSRGEDKYLNNTRNRQKSRSGTREKCERLLSIVLF